MRLPESKQLCISKLNRIFDNMSESYKIFWFWAIINFVHNGKSQIGFEELINEMIANAWYMVSEYKLNLGPSDTMEKLIHDIYENGTHGLSTNAKKEDILSYLTENNDKDILSKKSALIKNVPYRLLTPFLTGIRATDWNYMGGIIERINHENQGIYLLSHETGWKRKVILRAEWVNYLNENYEILMGWIQYNLVQYLQKRNPNVPGIPNKIAPPMERNLNCVKKYWRAIIDIEPPIDIYTGRIMTEKDVSIDHFIPWSYVTHDELWNLVPTTRSANSSKSNRLPGWDTFFPKLLEVEYHSMKLRKRYDKINRLFLECRKEHINSSDVWMKLYNKEMSKDEFGENLEDIMLPVYQSAKNLGFPVWEHRI